MRRLPFLLLCGAACSSANFSPASLVDSVRLLATAADHPYAAPGQTVNVTALVADGRSSRALPLRVFWLPNPCINPPDDAYFACYPAFSGQFQPERDLSAQLVEGTSFSFTLPGDAVHASSRGGTPYGVAFAFLIACAGHVEYLAPASGGSPEQLPFGCFDESENQLGPEDYVFGFAQVFAFDELANANPVIQGLTWAGVAVDPDAGITLTACADGGGDCPASSLDVQVPASSDELDPLDLSSSGAPLHEQIYVDYYLTGGSLEDDVVTLYDSISGAVSNTGDSLTAPSEPGDYQLWAVVHDDRGGVSWEEALLHVR